MSRLDDLKQQEADLKAQFDSKSAEFKSQFPTRPPFGTPEYSAFSSASSELISLKNQSREIAAEIAAEEANPKNESPTKEVTPPANPSGQAEAKSPEVSTTTPPPGETATSTPTETATSTPTETATSPSTPADNTVVLSASQPSSPLISTDPVTGELPVNKFGGTTSPDLISPAVAEAQGNAVFNKDPVTGLNILKGDGESDKTDAETDNTNAPSDNAKKEEGYLTNVLHDFASYTYAISLHVLTQSLYNALIDNPGGYSPNKNVLISSSGQYNTPDHRHPVFNNMDFFIDDLKFQTIIGAAAGTQNANTTTISFKVYEPNGLSLIPRIRETAIQLNSSSEGTADISHLELPYLLQIEFFGYDNNGNPESTSLKNITKYIPCRITNIDISLTAKGAEYTVSAVTFNDIGLNNTIASVPININVKATTVKSFFPNISANESAAIKAQQKDLDSASRADRSPAEANEMDTMNNEYQVRTTEQDKVANKYYDEAGLTDALNTYALFHKRKGLSEFESTVDFIFDKEIADAIVYPDSNKKDVNDVPNPSVKNNKGAKPPSEGVKWPVNAGTTITEILSTVIRNSSYIRKQFKEGDMDAKALASLLNAGKGVDWFKIIPIVKLGGFNKAERRFATHVTYYVKKYTIWNTKYPFAANGFPTSNLIRKKYDYIFSGENRDILDLKVEFNTQYFISYTVQPNKNQAELVNNDSTNTDKSPYEMRQMITSASKGNFMPNKYYPRDNAKSSGSNVDERQARIDDFNRLLMDLPAVDMITMDLKIVGDPQFIKQDSIFFAPKPDVTSSLLTPNSSFATDYSEIFVLLNFNTPTDYDMSTGVLDRAFTEPKEKTEVEVENRKIFSGTYKVTIVDNTFSRGKFEQSLQLIRMNELNNVVSAETTDTKRETPGTQQSRVDNLNKSLIADATAADLTIKSSGDIKRYEAEMAERAIDRSDRSITSQGDIRRAEAELAKKKLDAAPKTTLEEHRETLRRLAAEPSKVVTEDTASKPSWATLPNGLQVKTVPPITPPVTAESSRLQIGKIGGTGGVAAPNPSNSSSGTIK